MYCEGCRVMTEQEIESVAEQGPMSLVSKVTEFNDLHDFMLDDQLDRALEIVINCYMREDVSPAKAIKLIVELQALSTKFAIQGKVYETFKSGPPRSEEAHKKNLYKNMNAALDKMVDALKHVAKQGSY